MVAFTAALLLVASATSQSALPKASVKSENSQFVFTGADVAFELDDASGSTSVLKLKSEVDQIGQDLSDMLTSLAASDEELLASVSALRKDTNKLLVDVNQGMADYKAESDARQEDLTASFNSGIQDIKAAHESGIASMTTEYITKMSTSTSSMSTVTDRWNKNSKAMEGRVTVKLQNMQKDYVAKVADVQSRVTTLDKNVATGASELAKKADAQQVIWIGGMRSHMYSGWRTMTFNRIELDAKGSHFSVHSSYFQIKKPGVYRFNLWCIQYGQGGTRYMVRINGGNMMNEGHQEVGERYSNWRNWYRHFWEDTHIDQTWYFKANEKIEFRSYSPSYSLHGSSNRNAYNRVTLHWLGETSASLRV